jgi:hypothetical protein
MRTMCWLLCALLITVALIVTPSRAGDSGCEPDWMPSFEGRSGTFGLNTTPPGVSGDIYALTTFDDGSGRGPELYAGGRFVIAGGAFVQCVARWDGARWWPLGSGVALGGIFTNVRCLAVFDDGSGSGPALYAGGFFSVAGGQTAKSVARWNGMEWSPVGGGMDDAVFALAVFDDGSGGGPALYAGGSFTLAGGTAASRIARWNGRTWSPVSSGMSSSVFALETFDDGSGGGPKLFAGGAFTSAGGSLANRVARWDGSMWVALGTGTNNTVLSLEAFHDGTRSRLYVGGQFSTAGGEPASRIASWDGRSWSSVGAGVSGPAVRALAVSALDSRQPVLIAGGEFTAAGGVAASSIARWDGVVWSALAEGVEVEGATTSVVFALASMNGQFHSQPLLSVGGRFDTAGGATAINFATWDGASWPRMPSGLDDRVLALVAPAETGEDAGELYIGGLFKTASGLTVNGVARWDGESWQPLGGGLDGEVTALAFFDDGSGSGPALYVGGGFTTAGGVPASNIARWDGSAWSNLGEGLDQGCTALVVHDAGLGAGPALYAGGYFTTAGGVLANGLARWDGKRWSAVGGGLGGPRPLGCESLIVHDDGLGQGPALYIGGLFKTAGGTPANNIAKWDGEAWSALGAGTSDGVQCLARFDDGSGGGAKLIVGGWFNSAGGLPANSIASWDGNSWSELGAGLDFVPLSLASFPGRAGESPRLYAAVAAALVAWDGASWTYVPQVPNGAIVLLSRPGTPSIPPSLVVGGFFETSAAGDSFITRLVGCPSECPADLTFDGIVGQEDLAVLLGAWGASGGDLDADGTTSSADLAVLLGGWGSCP